MPSRSRKSKKRQRTGKESQESDPGSLPAHTEPITDSYASNYSSAEVAHAHAVEYWANNDAHPLSDERLMGVYRSGLEVISDATLGLHSSIHIPPQRGLWDHRGENGSSSTHGKPSAPKQPKRSALKRKLGYENGGKLDTPWRTAVTTTITLANLPQWEWGYTFSKPPPRRSSLPELPPLPHAAVEKDKLLSWDAVWELDPDPTLDELEEFEPWTGWPTPAEGPPQEESADAATPTADSPSPLPSDLSSCLSDYYVGDDGDDMAVDRSDNRSDATNTFAPPLVPETPDTPPSPAERLKWWRSEMKQDGYGDIWSTLKHHYYDRVYSKTKHVRPGFPIPDPLGPPCHPDFAHYMRTAAKSVRVMWIIPVMGPVVVPGYDDPVVAESGPSWTSSGKLVQSDDLPVAKKKCPAPLIWNPPLLNAFMDYVGEACTHPPLPYGSLRAAASGPKPVPHFTPPPPLSIDKHQYLSEGADQYPPVRFEAGDHIRLYCDARHAMAVRLWLHCFKVDLAQLRNGNGGSSSTHEHVDSEIIQPFDGVRLMLAGQQSEVLLIA